MRARQELVASLAVAAVVLFGGCGDDKAEPDESRTQDSAGAGGTGAATAGSSAGPGQIVIDTGGTGAGYAGSSTGNAGAAGAPEEAACGDGLMNQAEERCDDGNRKSGDGCSAECRVEAYYQCAVPGEPCRTTKVCGDGQLVGDEECDDADTMDGDGCSADCTLEEGYVCPIPGVPCDALCGDARLTGHEDCDDGDTADGDGCSSACRFESDAEQDANGLPSYWSCSVAGSECTRATCRDGVREGAEPCDDGNDRPADGCSPDCQVEPQCTTNGCVSRCGDGIMLPGESEECDDGNSADGDGCSASCEVEPGYECAQVAGSLPDELMIPVVYRDFVGAQRALDGAPVHPDFESTRGASATLGLVKNRLNDSGVPELTGLCMGSPIDGLLTGATDSACPEGSVIGSDGTYRFNQMSGAEAFAQWFEDDAGVNRTIVSRLCLSRQSEGDAYVFDSSIDNSTDCGPATTCADDRCWFLPINGQGFVAEGLEVDNLSVPDVIFGAADPGSLIGNFSFTSVVRTWFIYQGGERLEFSGDDDVWVFINGSLAVDLGGLHSIVGSEVILDDARATELGLVSGRIYEMVLFHAERYGYGSNFKLTLFGFVTARSECSSVCGDGILAGREVCDQGDQNVPAGSDDSYGRCTDRCELGARCGDGQVQADAGEECDDPSAQMTYSDVPGEGCTPGCKLPGYCGDGELQTGYEECDDGDSNSPDASDYGKCGEDCRLGPYCGDGITNGDEACDEGDGNGSGTCTIGCRVPQVY